MQLAEKNHSISQSELLEKITNLLSHQLRNEKERNELMDLQLQQNEDENGDSREVKRPCITLTDIESIQRDNRNLRDQIASTPEAPPTPPVSKSFSDGQPNHHRFALFRFQINSLNRQRR
ncbi:Protein CBG02204 [Caenorhabditis briggsae]|uniref:Protein CBG02204 n=1 Tax=Caenorhabditis briggsae TaxID=6238 RepID=A8WSA6_CAEBR|nr:Protein CBG02204 [Caenorhabditis briggsae]CAP23364.1 Protein CBG02204 [Caenorhabditis briggsae]